MNIKLIKSVLAIAISASTLSSSNVFADYKIMIPMPDIHFVQKTTNPVSPTPGNNQPDYELVTEADADFEKDQIEACKQAQANLYAALPNFKGFSSTTATLGDANSPSGQVTTCSLDLYYDYSTSEDCSYPEQATISLGEATYRNIPDSMPTTITHYYKGLCANQKPDYNSVVEEIRSEVSVYLRKINYVYSIDLYSGSEYQDLMLDGRFNFTEEQKSTIDSIVSNNNNKYGIKITLGYSTN